MRSDWFDIEKEETDLENDTDQFYSSFPLIREPNRDSGIWNCVLCFWGEPVLEVFLLVHIPVGDDEGNFLMFTYDEETIAAT